MKNAEVLVRAAIEAGCIVAPKGSVTAAAAGGVAQGIGGVLGRAAAESLTASGSTASPLAAGRHRLGYLCATAEDLVLLAARPAMVGQKATEVLGRMPRGAIAGVTMGPGKVTRSLSVAFTDGNAWDLEVPRIHAKGAEAFVRSIS